MSISLRLSVLSKNLGTLAPEAVAESVETLTEAIQRIRELEEAIKDFGFMKEDVALIRRMAYEGEYAEEGWNNRVAAVLDIANRIQARLPPEGKK